MRIYRVCERFFPLAGGMQIHALELSRRQAEAGHEVDIWIRNGSTTIPALTIHRVGPLKSRRYGGLVVTAAFMTLVLRRVLAGKVRPDILHLHGDFVEGWFGSRLARRLGVPSVMTIHGGLSPRYRIPSRYAFRGVDAFIALGANVARDLQTCGVPADRITEMSSGISWEMLEPWLGRSRPGRGRLVTVGSLDPVKGHDLAIEAYRIVKRSFPSAILTIVGDGPLRSKLEALGAQTGGVDVVGRQSRETVYEIVSKSDVFLMASRSLPGKSEGVPTALMEAMALGLPVVATREGGIPGLIRDGENGLLVDSERPDQIANAIEELLASPELCDRLGKAAASSVQDRGWGVIVEKVEEVYEAARSR